MFRVLVPQKRKQEWPRQEGWIGQGSVIADIFLSASEYQWKMAQMVRNLHERKTKQNKQKNLNEVITYRPITLL